MVIPKRATVVMLGASNLTRGISTAVAWAQHFLGSPLDFYVALGHGRSYGARSRVFIRELPGIRDCALWSEIIHRDPAIPVYGLITDIGNDILYKASVDEIVDWLRFALDQLRDLGACTILVQLPIDNILRASDWQFWLLRHILFPGRKLEKALVCQNALQLAESVAALATEYNTSLVHNAAEWYGFDPIHFQRRQWRNAWYRILSAWKSTSGDKSTNLQSANYLPPPLKQWFYLRALAPSLRWIAGRAQRSLQPAGILRDGSRIHLY